MGACALLLALGFSVASQAQTRPTLGDHESRIADQESRMGSLEDFFCESLADDSFRPLACDPACNCSGIEGFDNPISGSCVETSPGTFALSAVEFDGFAGTCGMPVPPLCLSEIGGAPFCLATGGSCVGSEDCSVGICLSNVCAIPCSTSADCPGSTASFVCNRNFTTCASSADCLAPGDTCADWLGGGTLLCSQSCSVDTDCDVGFNIPYNVNISGVGAVASSMPATCNTAKITSRDALECVAIAEAGVGSCTYLCGDGTTQAGEQCDDGNRVSGDGCDAACQQEP